MAEARHEQRDVHVRAIALAAAGLAVALVLVFLFFRLLGLQAASQRVSPQVEAPPPRLQVDPAADLAQYRVVENARLHGYGWVDRSAGIVHIPIERAMALTVERTLPARPQTKGGAP